MEKRHVQAMRVLLFSNAASTNRGGAEASFEAIADGLAERGHEVQRLYNETGGAADGKHRLSLPWIGLRGGLPTPRAVWTFVRHLMPLARLLRRLRPDVVVVHFVDLSSLYFAALRPLLGFRLVLNARGSDVLVQPRESERHRRLLPLALRRADHVVALSQAIADAAVALCPDVKGRVTVIHNGVDLDFWRMRVAEPDEAAPLIVAAGRLHPVKGFDVLIEAFAAVYRRVPASRLRIIGEGEERAALEALAQRLGVAGDLEMPGWVDREALRQAYQSASVVAVPSRSEGLGNVAIEAMAAGAAVVASAVGGLPDVVDEGRTGRLVPPEDVAALADSAGRVVERARSGAEDASGGARAGGSLFVECRPRPLRSGTDRHSRRLTRLHLLLFALLNVLSKTLERLLVSLNKRVAGRMVMGRVYDAHALARQKLLRLVADEGITQFNLIKVRSDGRCVASGVHPVFGRVAIKSWMATRDPFKAQANLHLSQFVQNTGEDLFPRVYRARAGYTLEAWTEGRCLSSLKPDEFEVAPVIALLDRLKKWSLQMATGQKMYPEDIEELVLRYVLKKMGHIRYGRKGRMVRRVRNVLTRDAALRSEIEAVQEQARQMALPQCGALMDIGTVNLIQSSDDGKIRVFDYDSHAQPLRFRCRYILHALRKRRMPTPLLAVVESHVFTTDYLGSEEAKVFFTTHYSMLNTLGHILG